MAGSIIGNNLEDDFYRKCLKAHLATISDSESDGKKSDFDEIYFKLKPPPVPYGRIKDDIVKLRQRDVNPQVRKEEGERRTYASAVKSFSSNERNGKVAFQNNQPQFDPAGQENATQAKKKRKCKRKRKKNKNFECANYLRENNEALKNENQQQICQNEISRNRARPRYRKKKKPKPVMDEVEFPVVTKELNKHLNIHQGDMNTQRESIRRCDRFLENDGMWKDQGRRTQQTSISMNNDAMDRAFIEICQREEAKLLENNRMPRPTTNDDAKDQELIRRLLWKYQKDEDVKFLQSDGKLKDQGKQANQQQISKSEPFPIDHIRVIQKGRALQNELTPTYQREEVKVLVNNRIPKEPVSQIYQHQTITLRPTVNDNDNRSNRIRVPREDVKFLVQNDQGSQVHQQQISLSRPSPIFTINLSQKERALKKMYQGEEVKLLENNKIIPKNPANQIYQQQTTTPKPTVNDVAKRPEMIKSPNAYQREISRQEDVKFLLQNGGTSNDKSKQVHQQISISESSPTHAINLLQKELALKKSYQREEVKLLENNTIPKNPANQIYQQQTTTSKSTTNHVAKHPQMIRSQCAYQREISRQDDVKFLLQNGGTSNDKGKQVHQEQISISESSPTHAINLLQKELALKKTYRREEVKLLENNTFPKNPANQIYQQQTTTPKSTTNDGARNPEVIKSPNVYQREITRQEGVKFLVQNGGTSNDKGKQLHQQQVSPIYAINLLQKERALKETYQRVQSNKIIPKNPANQIYQQQTTTPKSATNDVARHPEIIKSPNVYQREITSQEAVKFLLQNGDISTDQSRQFHKQQASISKPSLIHDGKLLEKNGTLKNEFGQRLEIDDDSLDVEYMKRYRSYKAMTEPSHIDVHENNFGSFLLWSTLIFGGIYLLKLALRD